MDNYQHEWHWMDWNNSHSEWINWNFPILEYTRICKIQFLYMSGKLEFSCLWMQCNFPCATADWNFSCRQLLAELDFYSWNNEAMVTNFNAYFCPNLFLQSEFDTVTLIWMTCTNREAPARLTSHFHDLRRRWINLVKGPSNLPRHEKICGILGTCFT